ncbi:MAG: hypothetical protein K8R85_08310, partial [Bacteroidetes bacterium]|nr:hypothetical protein [Bacteroidota bacterium]
NTDKLIVVNVSEKNNKLPINVSANSMYIDIEKKERIGSSLVGEEFVKFLRHEIGYHYETMDTSKGNVDKAYDEFCINLEMFRKIVPVTTICMHGSPLSKFDNRNIWQKYDYRKLGINAEPYFDVDFNKTFYLTDTGRRWDGGKVSIRDKAMDTNGCNNPDFLKRTYRTTFDIINDLKKDDFPGQVMMTFHPQRWTDEIIPWYKELFIQNLKNQIKRMLVK